MSRIFDEYQPDAVMHLAAESHVDRLITGSAAFIETNIVGTYIILECACKYWAKLEEPRKSVFRFHHISTDEVYGDLSHPASVSSSDNLPLFTEKTPYLPSSPYSSSKASSDHLVRAWHRTFGLPTRVTNCSNDYGPFHFPEKFNPLIILNAIAGKSLPAYGNGEPIRDWLYVEEHAYALYGAVTDGKVGETYKNGGHDERKNIDVVKSIYSILDDIITVKPQRIVHFADLITYVADRLGHDQRSVIDAMKMNWDGFFSKHLNQDSVKRLNGI